MGEGVGAIMYFADFSELMHMSGHGFYVWLCYGIVFVTLLALTLYPIRKKQRVFHAIKQRVLHEKGASNADAS